jgi:archaemetzincin
MPFIFSGCYEKTGQEREVNRRIRIVQIGDVERKVLKHLLLKLKERFRCNVDLGLTLPHPQYSYNPTRSQYHSTQILHEMSRRIKIGTGEKIIGIVDLDLYVPGLNFVFGEAILGGGYCVISLTRLRQSYYGYIEEEKRFFDRVGKEAVHEVGHTYGLGHCKDPNCVMRFSNSLFDTDRKTDDFCKRCRGKLK